MRDPKFSESQLQQATNTAFIQRVAATGCSPPFIHVPSLHAEFDLGWDSAAFLPWLSVSPHPGNEGCNFFVQYKLSCELNTPGAKEWAHWGDEYFRFKIPHASRNNGKNFDDYHQWDRLKALANAGMPTYYATNSFIRKSTLIKHYDSGVLLDHVRMLDVRNVMQRHKHVTFKRGCTYFRLHSEMEESPMRRFSESLASLREERQVPLSESTSLATKALMVATDDDALRNQIAALGSSISQREDPRHVLSVRLKLMALAYRHFGGLLLWCPKNG